MRRRLIGALMVIAVLLMAQSLLVDGGVSYQGSIAPPVQTELIPTEKLSIKGDEGDVAIRLLAEYKLKGVVKAKKKYNDYPSQISKYDIAIAWGDLNKEEYDEHIKYTQGSRWYYYNYSRDFPKNGSFIARNSANVHLVHSNEEILDKLRRIKRNDYVSIEGYLVEAIFPNGPWRSSLTRTDTGNGACEILYVIKVDIVN
jgi:hypothetical protein